MRSIAVPTLVGGVTGLVAVAITVAVMLATRPPCAVDGDVDGDVGDPARPVYHYAPRRGWANDPNGLAYYHGEWHLFYQHDFESTLHDNMSWGHAVSTDLVRWRELPVAIPYDATEQIFSGSVVVDERCASRLCASPDADPHAVLVAFYTSYEQQGQHIQSQHVANSTDRGRTWTKYEGNPVLDRHSDSFRDPKVMRHGDGWVMLVQLSDDHQLQFHSSKDLVSWSPEPDGTFGPTGEVGGVWECPDLFELAVDGNEANKKWVLLVSINPGNRYEAGSATQYWVGAFDGKAFTPDGAQDWLDYGMDNYAAITWDGEGERVAIGWMSNWNYTLLAPASDFRNAFTSPRRLALRTLRGRVRLTQTPVRQLAALRRSLLAWGDALRLQPGADANLARGAALDLELVLHPKNATEVGVRVLAGDGQETLVGYNAENGTVFVDRTRSGVVDFHPKFAGRHSAPYEGLVGPLRVRVLVDRGSVEAFFGEGEVAITDVVFPNLAKDGVALYTVGDEARVDSYTVWSMAPSEA